MVLKSEEKQGAILGAKQKQKGRNLSVGDEFSG